MDVNVLNNQNRSDAMKPPNTISNMIDDHHNGDEEHHHHHHHFVTVPYGQKSQMDLSDVDDPVEEEEEDEDDDDIRAAMISIMSSQAAASATNGFQNDQNQDDDEDYRKPQLPNVRSDPGIRICSSPSSTSSSPPPTSSINLKQSQNDYIIIIDDLFVRKLLHQICPEHFDETWLSRFKSQYLNSFLDNKNLNKENGEEQEEELEDEKGEELGDYRNRQKRILEQILSTNQLTKNDEFLVYWKLDHHQQHCHHDRDIFQNIKSSKVNPVPEESWLQNRDPMTYLYNFCELLMFLEMKFEEQKQKDRCQQLAREIRAYLYWISKDARFKEDSAEQEQLARMASSANKSPSEPILDSAGNHHNHPGTVGAEQKLFYSIVQHLLMICYELMMVTNSTSTTMVEIHRNKQKKRFYQVFEGYFGRSINDPKQTNSTLYEQWIKNLKNILIALVDYYELNPPIKLQQQQRFDCNNHHHLQPQQHKAKENQNNVVMLTTTPSPASSASASINATAVSAQYPANTGNGSNVIVPASSSSPPSSSSASSSSSSSTTTPATSSISSSHHYNHLMAPLSSSSSSMAHNSGNHNNHNGTSSTNVERHSSTTSSSGPSSGVGSFDSSVHHSSSSYNRDLFTPGSSVTGGQQKFLPSSASMAPSPANFTNATSPLTTTTTTTEDNNFSMLLQLNQLEDLDNLADHTNPNHDPQRIPKLIAPTMIHRPESNNGTSPTTFGFDFNSLNNPNRKEKNNNNTLSPNAEFAFRNPATTNSNCSTEHSAAIGPGADQNPTNGSLFHDLNITSLFSSFDDTISIGAESGTITDFNPHNSSSSNNNNTSVVGSLAIKHYPDPEQESSIQLPNQCFTMTLDQPKPFGHPVQQQQPAVIPKPLVLVTPKYGHVQCPPLNTPPLIPQQQHQQPLNHHTSGQESTTTDELCERQTLYRLIISQLLFDGHRNIACQVAGSEHIKCDSFLIGPSQELHKLVTFAKAKKKEDILMDKSQDHVSGSAPAVNVTPGFGRTNSSGYFDSTVGGQNGNNHAVNTNGGAGGGSPTQTTSPAMLATSQQTSPFSLRVEDPYSKAIYDHHSVGTHLNFAQSNSQQQQISPLFSNNSGTSTSITPHTSTSTQNSTSMLEYGDLNSSATDLYSPSSGQMEYYSFHSNRSPEMQTLNSPFNKTSPQPHNLNDLPTRQQLMVGGGVARGGSMKCMPSVVETTHQLVGANELVLTEACLKNINQLAKLNSSGVVGGEQPLANQNNGNNPLLGTGPNAGNNQPIMFGRSASAMAMTTPNGMNIVANNVQAPIGSTGNISRSPLTIKSPTGYPANHTTGNGKSHQIMQIVYKFGSLGQLKSQFSSPHGFCLGMNDEIIIADTNNHRICSYDKNGVFKQMFGNPGKDEGQLWYPRKITMIPQNYVRNNVNSPYYVICDRGMERSRMQIFTRNGNFVRKIPIRYIDIVAGIAINNRGHIVVVDSVSPTIYVITIDNGTLIEWRDCGDYMREPSDVAIYDDDYYICDFKGHCVVVIKSNGDFVRKIGMEGLTSFPNGIDISPTGDIFVGDSHGNKFHVVVFNRDGRLLAEYECPYCKVSRCCGLKLTKDNCIVTLAKNNHHVLVLNPNFQPSQQQLLQLQSQSQIPQPQL